jgi:hypothetical protein
MTTDGDGTTGTAQDLDGMLALASDGITGTETAGDTQVMDGIIRITDGITTITAGIALHTAITTIITTILEEEVLLIQIQ